jgi:hypothetical protein
LDQDHDGRFPDDSPVEIRYPLTRCEGHGRRSSLGLAELALLLDRGRLMMIEWSRAWCADNDAGLPGQCRPASWRLGYCEAEAEAISVPLLL